MSEIIIHKIDHTKITNFEAVQILFRQMDLQVHDDGSDNFTDIRQLYKEDDSE